GSQEEASGLWREVARGRGSVLCPRGRATSIYDPPAQRGYYYPDHHALIREVFAALDALSAKFPEHVDPGPVTYAGFSQGAIMGALLLRRAPARFPRAVLVEGGFAEWDVPVARSYKARGGERVLFGCGNRGCAAMARTALGYLTRAGVEAKLVHDMRAGHSVGASLGQQIATE